MKILLDACVDRRCSQLLTLFGHEAQHLGEAGLGTILDPQVAELAEQFDLLITLDLHRQRADWVAMHAAMLQHGVVIMRITIPKQCSDTWWALAMSLIYPLTKWQTAVAQEYALILIGASGHSYERRTRDQVHEMTRADRDTPNEAEN